jgi:phage anti-repressor protein/exonuclease VII small subunit
MNSLIKIKAMPIGGESVKSVNARELHSFLEIGKDFSTWVKAQLDGLFVQGIDFEVFPQKGENQNGRPKVEYALTIECSKHIAMMSRTVKGRKARDYFIECERRANEAADPAKVLSDPAAMRGLLLTYTEKVIELEETVKELEPKADALDRIATATDGSFCIRDAAKTLQLQEKKLRDFLLERRWVYRRPMGAGFLAYSDKLQFGFMEHKITKGEKSDGSEWISTQARITAKGMARLSQLLETQKQAA